MTPQILFGFHAVTVRLKTAARSVIDIHVDAARRDARMHQFVQRAREAGAVLVDSDAQRLRKLSGSERHQGVGARVEALASSPPRQPAATCAASSPPSSTACRTSSRPTRRPR